MKYLKLFENKEPKDGDWIIDNDGDLCQIISDVGDKFFIEYEVDGIEKHYYMIKEFPINIEKHANYIVHFGTKKEMEIIIQTNKYNI